MHWFAIFIPRETGAHGAQPRAARTLWDGARPLWLVNDWPDSEVRELRAGDRRMAVLGPCAAGEDDLRSMITRWQIPARPWSGSYTIIIQDAAYTEIHTDLAWTCPIYAARRPEGTYFVSSLLPLAALTGWRLDHAWLAVRLLCPDLPHLLEGRSPFTGVEILPPGIRATITTNGWHTTRTWTLAERRFPDGAAQLRAALVAGVAARVAPAHTITTDLSGGLDSTSITFLAARAASPDAQLIATTLRPAGTDHGGDLDHARRAAAALPELRHELVAIDQRCLPYTDVTGVPLTDEPAPSTATFARFRRQLQLLARLGSDCHLTGDGGDGVLTAPLCYLADLARNGHVRPLLEHAAGWAQLLNHSALSLLLAAARQARRHDASPSALLHRLLTEDDRAVAYQVRVSQLLASESGPAVRWFTVTARRLAAGRAAEVVPCAVTDQPMGDRVALQTIHTMGCLSRSEMQLAGCYCVSLHNPFLDAAVVDACLSVPAEERTSPWVPKPLLQAALARDVPPFVFTRRTKGDFTADEYLGIRTNAAQLRDLFSPSRLTEFVLVQDVAVRDVIDQAVAGFPVDLPAFDALVATEAWLRALSRDRTDNYWSNDPVVLA